MDQSAYKEDQRGDLYAPLSILKGVGSTLARRLKDLLGQTILDACWHLPNSIKMRHPVKALREAKPGDCITIALRIKEHRPPYNRRISPRSPYCIICQDMEGWYVDLVYFRHPRWESLQHQLKAGEERLVVGVCDEYHYRKRIVHPEHIGAVQTRAEWEGCFPVYPASKDIPQKLLASIISQAIERFPELPEWIPDTMLQHYHWRSLKDTLYRLHHPSHLADIEPTSTFRQRLAYDELLAHQLALSIARRHHQQKPGRSFQASGMLRGNILSSLPFKLTTGQQQALQDIDQDMAAPSRMMRLLQGDVGSGKTIVSFLAMLNAVECGAQAALLAPTEILARQHASTLSPLAQEAGISLGLFTGKDKARQQTLQKIKEADLSIVVGTHALLQEDVEFKDLGLIVIDEQHRFGVEQRITLSEKGKNVDCLLMSATPIPRTLLLTLYGDLAISSLRDKPAGRQEIVTKTIPLERLEEVIQAIERAIHARQKIYWICPLVEESEALDVAAAMERYEHLKARFPERVGLVHGQMKGSQKEDTMAAFQRGDINLLVATTVVEVGVDVPDATIMVIEHAERFGLSQLHQLRGRVGRGPFTSTCLLLYSTPLGETAKARLKVMRSTNDGFLIAEEDLRLRGGGDVLGTRQSGWPKFRFAHYDAHKDLLALAHKEANSCVAHDPFLSSSRGQALRVLLDVFDHPKTISYIKNG